MWSYRGSNYFFYVLFNGTSTLKSYKIQQVLEEDNSTHIHVIRQDRGLEQLNLQKFYLKTIRKLNDNDTWSGVECLA